MIIFVTSDTRFAFTVPALRGDGASSFSFRYSGGDRDTVSAWQLYLIAVSSAFGRADYMEG